MRPFLNWRFFARCVIQWSRAPVKHNGSSKVERKCVMVRNVWKELYSENCLGRVEVDFCSFLRRGYVWIYTVCHSECVALASTVQNYIRYFCYLTEKFSSPYYWGGNPLGPSCEAEVKSKNYLYFPSAMKLTGSILGQLTLNVLSLEFVSIFKLMETLLW